MWAPDRASKPQLNDSQSSASNQGKSLALQQQQASIVATKHVWHMPYHGLVWRCWRTTSLLAVRPATLQKCKAEQSSTVCFQSCCTLQAYYMSCLVSRQSCAFMFIHVQQVDKLNTSISDSTCQWVQGWWMVWHNKRCVFLLIVNS